MHRAIITIEIWPFSTGAGAEADQAAAGQRVNTFEVDATSIHAALKVAASIADGIKTNPRVWEAPIRSIVMKTPA